MATTTNYSWTTPDDTALVKDGAAAIRTLGSSVDTTVKNLNPETTLGDLAYRSSTANVKTRLGLGTAGQVLQVNSGATAPEWATPSSGGMTLLSTTTLSGATTTVSGISGSYNNLQVIIYGMTNNTFNEKLLIGFNGLTTGADTLSNDSTGIGWTEFSNQRIEIMSQLRTDANNVITLNIYNYASTTTFKSFNGSGILMNVSSVVRPVFLGGAWASNSAVTSLTFANSGGTWASGTVLIYGVK
jgi:hypothetical protein